jgi:hypothetical protein
MAKISPKMKQIVLRLFLLAAPIAAGLAAAMARQPAALRSAAEHQPKEVRVFLSEDRTDQPCAWLQ